ncbi:protein outspread [Elysia marginata]|uniref:Protein outspread n=1 Tax=Elysia marginata TaxID=1093978 RepID=A0AAV4GGJ0_9GAST|nr:protein outspread [Elysia marginata]
MGTEGLLEVRAVLPVVTLGCEQQTSFYIEDCEWQDTLAEFPKALKSIKPRRKQPFLILSNKDTQEDATDSAALDGQDAKNASGASGAAAPHSYSTFRGVRSMKHRYDTTHQDGLRKSSSLHDLSTTAADEDGGVGSGKDLSPRGGGRGNLSSSRFLSRSGDRLDVLGRREKSFSLSSAISPPREQRPGLPVLPHPPAITMPRSTWTRTGQPVPPSFLAPPSSSSSKSRPSSTASSSSSTSTSPRRSSFDDRPPPSSASAATSASSSRGIGAASAAESRKLHRERSSSLKEFPTQFSLLVRQQQQQQQQQGEEDVLKPGGRTPATSSISDRGSVCSMSADDTDSNETDELKLVLIIFIHHRHLSIFSTLIIIIIIIIIIINIVIIIITIIIVVVAIIIIISPTEFPQEARDRKLKPTTSCCW